MYSAQDAPSEPQLDRAELTPPALTCWQFMRACLRHPRQTGSFVPSQRFLAERMVAPIPRSYAGHILELGAGTGAVTARLAARCPDAQILACEVNPSLARDCAQNLAANGLDARVKVVSSTAQQVLAALARRGNERPGYVISGLPLGNLARERVADLLEAIRRVLRSGGLYIQFQYSLLDRRKIKARFPRLRTVPVFLNLPPAVVYYAER